MPHPSSIKIDLASAFAAAGMRAIAWAAVSTIVLAGGLFAADYAVLTLIRSTLGLLNYTTLGLAPAMIRWLAGAFASDDRKLQCAVYSNGQIVAAVGALLGLAVVIAYALLFRHIHRVQGSIADIAPTAALLIGIALLLRLLSDVPGAWLQSSRHIALDNTLLIMGELLWIIFAAILIRQSLPPLLGAAIGLGMSSAILAFSRFAFACVYQAPPIADRASISRPLCMQLLGFGILVSISQLADFLYAPTDFILINRFLTSQALSDYAIAVQIDAGLLLISGAIAAVLLPKASAALARGARDTVRRYYLYGTFASLALLAAASAVILLTAPGLFTLWLHNDMPGTRAILPLLLIHTIVGGCSGVGRSILLAAGKVKAFASAAIIAGIANVAISYLLVRYTDLGLTGIVLGTVIAVVARCALWMPWYIMRTLRADGPPPRVPPASFAIPESL